MMNRTPKLVLTASALFLALFVGRPDTASAASRGSTVTVTTSVKASCNIYAGTIAFADYDPVNTHPTGVNDDQTGTFNIRCTKNATGITIDMGNGGNNSGTQRRMVNASDAASFLSYEIYKDSFGGAIWGAGDGGTVRSGADLNGTGADVAVTMFGRIPGGQLTATAGAYSDTVVSTINF